ncbi:hypothetical protein RYX36_007805 [Vicia faba]
MIKLKTLIIENGHFSKGIGTLKCRSLKSFPEFLDRMTNIKEIWLFETSIGELPFSFQSLSELDKCVLLSRPCPRLKKKDWSAWEFLWQNLCSSNAVWFFHD